LHSLETIKHCLFDDANAAALWRAWTTSTIEGQNHFGFLSYMLHHIDNCILTPAQQSSRGWSEACYAMGLSGPAALRHNDNSHPIRLTRGIKFWVKESITWLYEELLMFARQSRARGRYTRNKRQALQGQDGRSAASSSGAGGAGGGNARGGVAGAPQQVVDIQATLPDIIDSVPAGYTVMWKGLNFARTEELLVPGGNGRVAELNKIISQAPGDFHAVGEGYYLTKDKSTAADYVQYAMRRTARDSSFVCLLRMVVPTPIITSLNDLQLYASQGTLWAEVVFNCRKRQQPDHLLYLGDYDLIFGTCAKSSNTAIEASTSFHQITNENILRRYEGGNATQYYFSSRCGRRVLQPNARITLFKV
jgi:hypothetical protein